MDGGQPPLDASTDADNGDAAPDDASVDPDDSGTTNDAGTSGFCPQRPDVIFCDGFEPLDFENWSYPVVTNGTLTRSTAQKHSGEASLRATTGAAMQGNEARYATSTIPHLKSGDLWLRYYYFVPSTVTVNSHFSAGVLSEIEEPWAGFSLIVRDTTTDLTTMNGPFSGSTKFPRQRWVCVELHVRISPTDGIFEGYLDGQRVVYSTTGNTVPADGFRNAEVGIHYAEANQGPVEAYVDDVVVATARVPCD